MMKIPPKIQKGKKEPEENKNEEKPKKKRTKVRKMKDELNGEQKGEIKDAFEFFKETGLNPDDFKLAMKILNLDPENPEIKRILEKVDKHGKKGISYEEYMDIFFEKPSKDPKVEGRKMFDAMKEKDKDIITTESLAAYCNEIGEVMTEDEIRNIIEESDFDQDGKVGFEDFMQAMLRGKIL